MSIPVKIEDLAATLSDFDTAYLLSVGDRGIKVVCVEVEADAQGLQIPTHSKGTASNLARNPAVTLLCPPRRANDFTLLVDGTAAADADGFRMSPQTAVLHRPAPHADRPVPADGCGHDCKSVDAG